MYTHIHTYQAEAAKKSHIAEFEEGCGSSKVKPLCAEVQESFDAVVSGLGEIIAAAQASDPLRKLIQSLTGNSLGAAVELVC